MNPIRSGCRVCVCVSVYNIRFVCQATVLVIFNVTWFTVCLLLAVCLMAVRIYCDLWCVSSTPSIDFVIFCFIRPKLLFCPSEFFSMGFSYLLCGFCHPPVLKTVTVDPMDLYKHTFAMSITGYAHKLKVLFVILIGVCKLLSFSRSFWLRWFYSLSFWVGDSYSMLSLSHLYAPWLFSDFHEWLFLHSHFIDRGHTGNGGKIVMPTNTIEFFRNGNGNLFMHGRNTTKEERMTAYK